MGPGDPMYASLPTYVAERSHRSMHLCEGLRAALEDIQQPGLARIVQLIESDARAANCAAKLVMENRRARLEQRTLADLRKLVALGGRGAIPIVLGLARRMNCAR